MVSIESNFEELDFKQPNVFLFGCIIMEEVYGVMKLLDNIERQQFPFLKAQCTLEIFVFQHRHFCL